MDLEGTLALLIYKLAKWSNIPYSGEFRNACAAHLAWGWALTLTLDIIVRHSATWSVLEAFLIGCPALYGIFREVQDAQYHPIFNWNRKSTIDLITWEFGCLIGIVVICLI